jgi:hypothetical protein
MTPTEFAPIWKAMLRAWPAARPIEGTATEYASRLAAFTLAEVAAVVHVLILECEFLPSIATVWRRCVEARDQAPAWEHAWQEAEAHASGSGEPWSHEVAREAARVIGTWEIRTSTNPAATRAQFRGTYLSILERRRREFAANERQLPLPAHAALEVPNGRRPA